MVGGERSGPGLGHTGATTPDGARPAADPVVRTERLTRQVDGRRLVDGVSMEVRAGEMVAVIGPSGAGKSSLLRLLNRLDEPTAGTVYYEGRDYREIAPRELRQRMGMLLQQPFLFPGSVAENLRFGPAARGEELANAMVEELLERVGLRDYAERDVRGLSGGEAQRVALARTLANHPDVLLLDEPTSALDEAAQRGVERLICEIIRDNSLTCIIVTHDREQARRMSERGILLREGRVVDSGPIAEMADA